MLDLATIRIDGGTQPRSKIDEAIVAEYTAALRDGATFPAVIVFHDGVDHWLADGFHRYHAHRQISATQILADVRTGTKRDAILYSVSANAAHGLRRTNEDKHRSVVILLEDHEWSTKANSWIAEKAAVNIRTVERIKAERRAITSDNVGSEKKAITFTNKHGKVSTMRTDNIGKRTLVDSSGRTQTLREGQESRETRVTQIKALTAKGYRAAQIEEKLGISEAQIRVIANEAGIKLVDHVIGRSARIDNRRVVEQTVLGLEASAASLKTIGISFSGITQEDAADWAESLTASIRSFTSLRNKLKEFANGQAAA